MRHVFPGAAFCSSFALILAMPGPALASECPAAPDHTAAVAPLYEALQAAKSDQEGRFISNQLWEYWTDAPDEPAQALLDAGMRARATFDFAAAYDAFDRLVAYCPAYAEGYNQRAFVNFLREDYAAAVPDLRQAIKLNPKHIGALSGLGLTLNAMGREDESQAVLRAAVALNPWLGERFLLKEPPGKDL